MNDKQLQLVSFEQAKRLKAAGFDWHSVYFYTEKGKLECWGVPKPRNHNDDSFYSASTVALALEWFRRVKNIPNGIFVKKICNDTDGNPVVCNTEIIYIPFYIPYCSAETPLKPCSTHKAASSALLDELLTLIEK